jgi:hypothetical protein
MHRTNSSNSNHNESQESIWKIQDNTELFTTNAVPFLYKYSKLK